MHKMLLNTLELRFAIQPDSPILIKSGVEAGADPTLPDMNFVRGAHPATGGTTVYLPGSSLKGVIRSHAERIARTMNVPCCDPLDDRDTSPNRACDRREPFRKNGEAQDVPGPESYKRLCTTCRLFGHTVMASHFLIADAYPDVPLNTLPIRQMVAIDRRSGGSVNTFTMEVAPSHVTTDADEPKAVIFKGRLILRNFERWQVGLLALTLRDIAIGRVGVGFGKSRGLGQVHLTYEQLTLTYPGKKLADGKFSTHIYGLGELISDEEMLDQYDFMRGNLAEQPDFSNPQEADDTWGQIEINLQTPEQVGQVFVAQISAWNAYVECKRSATP